MGGRLGVGRREDAQHRREGHRGAVGSEAGQWQSHHGKRGLGGHGVELCLGNPAGNDSMEKGWKLSVSEENRI